MLRLPILMVVIGLLDTVYGVAPTIDLSHNMRILKLPQDTKVGTVIYRLRGSDPDSNSLSFGVRGNIGRRLLDIHSGNDTRADVILKSEPTEKEYKLTIFVTDGTQTTEVESTIIITNATNQISPFLEYNPLITVSELTAENEIIGTVIVRRRNSSSLPVLFEIKDSDKFTIKYVISPLKDASKAELSLLKKLDYEKQNLFKLKIYALNPWTDEGVDTRNIATVEMLIEVKDEQDTPPIFKPISPVIKVSDSLSQDDEIVKVEAEDGDYGNQRTVTYKFVPGSHGLPFFRINPETGSIRLASSIDRLRQAYSTTGPIILSLQATEIETTAKPGPPMSSQTDISIVLVNTENRPPRFHSNRYVGMVGENSPPLTAITWAGAAMPRVIDDDQGKNGSFEIFIEGDEGAFSVQPSRAMNELNFALLVKSSERLDYETSDTKYIEFRIVAAETAAVRPLSATAEVRIKIFDSNDNIPRFSHSVYDVSIPEDASPGTIVAKVQATDEDSGDYGQVRYTAINGPIAGNLRMDPVTGEITLVSSSGFDRERVPEYTLTVEARDDLGKGNRNAAELHVSLLDANDNAPLFLQPRYDAVLNPDMKNFFENLRVQAFDADAAGPNSNVTYEIVNGNYQEKFTIDPFTGEVTLREPLITSKDNQEHGLPVITLTVRAHDQGVPVRYSTVKVQVHNQEYLNRSITFIIPRPARDVYQRKQDLERGLIALTGAHVNIHSVVPHNISGEKSIMRCWVSYPLSSTVDLNNMDAIISNIFGREYYLSESKVEAVNNSSFDAVFWLLIALVILMILAILALFFYCCCVRATDGSREKTEINNKILPEDNIISYKEDGAAKGDKDGRRRSQSLTREAWSANQRHYRFAKRSMSAADGLTQPSEPTAAAVSLATNATERIASPYRNGRADGAAQGYYRNGPPPAGGHMERAYRQGRPLSPGTEMMIQDIGQDGVSARRVGNYVVVRKTIRPRGRVGTNEVQENGDRPEDGPKRTEILYIRSPLRDDEDDVNKHYVPFERSRDVEHLRSVSETAINGEETSPPTLRVPRSFRPRLADYRSDTVQRLDGPNQQLKFSRYHRTDSDVYLMNDRPEISGQTESNRPYHPPQGPPSNWGPSFIQHDLSRERAAHPTWSEHWEAEDYYQRVPVAHRHQLSDTSDYKRTRDNSSMPEELARVSHREQQLHQEQLQIPHLPSHLQQQSLQSEAQQSLQISQVEQIQTNATQQLQIQQQQKIQLPQKQSDYEQEQCKQQERPQFLDHHIVSKGEQQGQMLISEIQHPIEMQTTELSHVHSVSFNESQTIAVTNAKTAQQEHLTQNDQNVIKEQISQKRLEEKSLLESEKEDKDENSPEREQMDNAYQATPENSQEGLEEKLESESEIKENLYNEPDERKLLRVSTEEEVTQNQGTDMDGEDSDSGIGKDGTGLRLKKANLLEKKSLFTIAYDGMQTRGLKSAGDRDDSP